jgi:hypothetical protein
LKFIEKVGISYEPVALMKTGLELHLDATTGAGSLACE